MPNSNTSPRTGKFDEEIERKRLRDQFAGRAMEAMLGSEIVQALMAKQPVVDLIGKAAYEIADGMMKAREGK